MRTFSSVRQLTGSTLVACLAAATVTLAQAPPVINSGRVTIAGTSNVHDYTASTTQVRVTRARLAVSAAAGADLWDQALKPGAIEAFEIAIPAATLASPKGDLDKNMHKALQVEAFPEITFRLTRIESGPDAAGARAIGMLKIAGVEREVTLALTLKKSGAALTVHGRVDLLMTDYGVTPPKAMLGMLKTDPKVTVTFETVVAIPTT